MKVSLEFAKRELINSVYPQTTSKYSSVPPRGVEYGDSEIRHKGSVRFDPVTGESGRAATRVSVRLSYVPPVGAFGHAVAAMFGADQIARRRCSANIDPLPQARQPNAGRSHISV